MRGSEFTISEFEILMGREELQFTYRNWEGNIAERTVKPINIFYGGSDYHAGYGLKLFLKAYDVDKQAVRHFLIEDILDMHDFERPKAVRNSKKKVD